MSAAKKSVFTISLAICSIYAINGGVRGNLGVLLNPIAESSGLSYADVSFVFAVSQLLFGALQPIFGIIALKISERFVLIAGALMMAIGFLLTPFCQSMWSLMLAFGILFAAGTAALSFGLLLSIASPQLSKEQTSTVSGFLNASSGAGTTLLAPLLTLLTGVCGLLGAMLFLGLPSLFLIPVIIWLCRRPRSQEFSKSPAAAINPSEMIRTALKNRSYIFLLTGFFTCGFHMAILETHYFNELTASGFERSTAALAFTIYGVLTITGSALCGVLCNYVPKNLLLGSIYAVRIFLAGAVLFFPKTLLFIMIFAIFLGLTSDSTVSPTSGLLIDIFGAAKLPTLFGLAFLTHQCGAFLSAWLGGLVVEAMGSYDLLWMADALLATLAAAVSFAVRK